MTTQYGFLLIPPVAPVAKPANWPVKTTKPHAGVSFRRIYEYAGGDWQEDNGVWQQNVFAYYLSIACNHCEIRPAPKLPERGDA
jgi:anaerobic dimethyl sulfoxide reductase subunit B (iron-sulfur subunit)